MKPRNREINVFSMSALDLFASALGAFILISIVLMPYFLRPPIKTRFPDLDIVIALDTTGSMREQIGGLKSEIVQLTHLLHKLTPSLGVGLIDFKDRCDPATAVRALPLRRMDPAGLNALVSFARTMSASGAKCNPDSEEALAAALDVAIASAWRPDAKWKVIVVITDSPAYRDRQGHALTAARRFSARGPDSTVSVAVRGSSNHAFLRRLAEAGKGKYIRAGGSFGMTILEVLAR